MSHHTQNIVDVTTQNVVYNPTTAQGQWFQHRWGQRQYPQLDLELDWLKLNVDAAQKYDLHSVYGDPICWPHLVNFVEWCKIKPEIFTYANTDDLSTFRCLKKQSAYTVVKLDGVDELCGRVYLGAQWSKISPVLDTIAGHGGVELQTYNHNRHQIPQLIALCKKLQLQLFLSPGVKNDQFGTSVIDQDCNWLYDIVPYDAGVHMITEHNSKDIIKKIEPLEPEEPKKCLWAYKSLRTYMPPSQHRSIWENPLLGKMSHSPGIVEKFHKEYHQQQGVFVTPDHKILWNHKIYTMYMYLLANDWKLDNAYLRQNNNSVFVSDVLLYAERILSEVIQQTP